MTRPSSVDSSRFRAFAPVVAALLFALTTTGCDKLEARSLDTREADADADVSSGDGLDVEDADVLGPFTVTPDFDPEGDGFYDLPWPTDMRRDPTTGQLQLDAFPGNHSGLLVDYLDEVEKLTGYSIAPVVYFGTDGAAERLEFPTAAETMDDDASVMMLRVDSDGCGERIPVIVSHQSSGDRFIQRGTIKVRPVPGFWLQRNAVYAVLLDTALGTDSGGTLERPAAFVAALEQNGVYEPLRTCADSLDLALDDVAVATVFTTQDPVTELRTIREQVRDPDQVESPTITDWTRNEDVSEANIQNTWFANYETPIYQMGTPPYADEGGAFAFDPDTGEPVVQRWETVPLTVAVPAGAANDTDPHPVLVWIDGTGASRTGHLGRRNVIRKALDAGFVIVSFVPQMHEGRGPDADPVLHGFNYLNPTSGRTVFRQQAVDTIYLIRVIREGLATADFEGLPPLATDRLLYGGHSQGAIVGAITAGVEDDYVGWLLNGVGSYLSVTAVERTDPFDVAELIGSAFGIDKDMVTVEHPLVQLAQTGADAVDPQSYAPYWLGAEATPRGTSVFMLNGYKDHTTFPRSINALTISSGAPPLDPPGWDVDPHAVWDQQPVGPPIAGNREGLDGTAQTLGSYLNATTGHYTLHDIPLLQDIAVDFWLAALEGTPVITGP